MAETFSKLLEKYQSVPRWKLVGHNKIAKYKSEYGERPTAMALYLLTLKLNASFKFPKESKLTEIECLELAEKVLKDFWHMSLAEFASFCDRCALGDFGKMFGKFDKSDFMTCLEKYFEERELHIEESNRQKKESFSFHPDVAKALEPLIQVDPLEKRKEILSRPYLQKEAQKRYSADVRKLIKDEEKQVQPDPSKMMDEFIKDHNL